MQVRYFHLRTFAEKGGVTFRVEGDTQQVKVQYAQCSLQDNYSRALGRSRASAHKEHFMPLRKLPNFMENIALNYIEDRAPLDVGGFDFAVKYFLPK